MYQAQDTTPPETQPAQLRNSPFRRHWPPFRLARLRPRCGLPKRYVNPSGACMKFIAMALCFVLGGAASIAHATDRAGDALRRFSVGKWEVIEFVGPRELTYRIATEGKSTQSDLAKYIVFNFLPSLGCEPAPALQIVDMGTYRPGLENGWLPLSYKVPGRKEQSELVRTRMSEGDNFAFLQFFLLEAQGLLAAKDIGHLTIWVPGSADGTVTRSKSMFFSLHGFTAAYQKASQLCKENL